MFILIIYLQRRYDIEYGVIFQSWLCGVLLGGGVRDYFVQIRLLASRLGVAPDGSSIEYSSTVRPFIAGLPALRRSRFLFTLVLL